jgi:hypothetical protein
MKNVLSYILVLCVFIIIDGFIRSIVPNFRLAMDHAEYDFWGFLFFFMGYFIFFQSWFYFGIAAFFLGVSYFINFSRLCFILVGALVAFFFYLLYCLNGGDEIWSEIFYIRSIQYLIFGGYFGSFRYRKFT